MKAVQFSHYGGVEVLELVDVATPIPTDTQVIVRIKAAGINPGEAKIREGAVHHLFPATFPSGEGSDFAGVVDNVGPGVTKFKLGDEVAGHTDARASHAEYVAVGEENLVTKPEDVPWEVAGALFIAGVTAYAAVRAVGVKDSDTLIVSGAAGGVGAIATQLARLKAAKVYGIAGDHDFSWLRAHDIVPISYQGDMGADLAAAVRQPVDAFIDTVGHGYVQEALALGVHPQRITTLVDYAAAQHYGTVTTDRSTLDTQTVLRELLEKISDGLLDVPIAKTFALGDVRDAYTFLDTHHHRGKVVLVP